MSCVHYPTFVEDNCPKCTPILNKPMSQNTKAAIARLMSLFEYDYSGEEGWVKPDIRLAAPLANVLTNVFTTAEKTNIPVELFLYPTPDGGIQAETNSGFEIKFTIEEGFLHYEGHVKLDG